jgi:hypothetical protein
MVQSPFDDVTTVRPWASVDVETLLDPLPGPE